MWNAPTKEQLRQIPKLYETEGISLPDKIIHFHLFIFDSDWFLAEYDSDGDICFGYSILNGDLQNSEWGLVSLSELKAINVQGIEIDRDLYWTPCQSSEILTICKAHGWPLRQPNKLMANMTA